MEQSGPVNIPYRHRGAMLGILLLATGLRLPWLGAQSIAFDEAFSLAVGLADWPTLFQAILSDGVHPPLFYAIHKGALALWGISEFGQRFSAAAFSIVGVALVYRAGRVIFDRGVGLLGAALLALNPLHVWLSQEARMYSLLGALTIASMIAFWQAVRTGRRRYWAALAALNSLIFLLHYFGFLVPLIQFVLIILTFRHNFRRLRPWTLVQAIAFVPLLPWLIATARREAQTFGIGFLVRPELVDLGMTFWNLALGSSRLFWPLAVLTMAVTALAVVIALRPVAPHKVRLRQARHLVGLWLLLPPLVTWLISQRRSFYADRYLSFAIPGLVLLLAFGASRVSQSSWRILLIIGLVAAGGYGLLVTHLDPAFQKDDWRGVAAYVTHRARPDDVVLLYTTHIKLPFDYYYRGAAPQKPISLNLEYYPIEPLTAGHQRAWVVYPYTRRPTHYPMQPLIPGGYWDNDPDRNPQLVRWLEDRVTQIINYQHFRGVQVWLVDLKVAR